MTVHRCILRRERFVCSVIKTALSAAVLLASVAANAFAAGSISGRVTSSTTTLGLAGTVVEIIEVNASGSAATASPTTDGSGNYTANVPAGTYAVFTQDIHGYINKAYNNVPCSTTCDFNAFTFLTVTNSAMTGVDFVLDPGGRIAGTVTSSATGLPIAGVLVNLRDSSGQIAFTTGLTDALGHYITDGGTATGNVFAQTTNGLGYQDEVYTNGAGNPHCLRCDVTALGLPIAVTLGSTTSNINFILDPGGNITGTVRDVSSAPLANVEVQISDSTGNTVDQVLTDASGNYATAGFPAGNYFAFTRNNNLIPGLVDQLYNGFTCVKGCNPTLGTPIAVTVGTTASGKNFVLPPGGTVTGTVTAAAGGTPISGAFVQFYTIGTSGPTLGLTIFEGGAPTDSMGQYHNAVLPPGMHYAVVQQSGFAYQLYSGLPCAGNTTGGFVCPVSSGTPIIVTAGAAIANVNFALATGGSISGTVTNAAGGAPLSNIQVQVFTSAGTNVGFLNTDGSGNYRFDGLAVGSYYVRTNTTQPFINQLYNGVVCVGCAVTASGGTLVAVTANTITSGINFALSAGGRIFGTVTNSAGGAPIQGVSAQFFNAAGVQMGAVNTNASGVYNSPGLPPGTYFVRTAVGAAQNFVDQLYTSFPCVPCTVTTGTPVVVTGTATTTINFALSAGGSISGTLTDAGAGGRPVASTQVQVFDSTGVLLKNVNTDVLGNYTATGLPSGNYLVRTIPAQNYVGQVYNGFPALGYLTTGTPVAVTVGTTHSGVNFALSSGGSLSGTVRDAVTSAPLAGVSIGVYSAADRVVRAVATDGFGGFTVTGLQAGTYYLATLAPQLASSFYIDKLYDNLPCLGCVGPNYIPIVTLPCTPSCAPTVTTGTAVVVTNGATRTGVDFALATGAGVISGAVTDAVTGLGLLNVQVAVYNASGVLVQSAASAANTGAFSVRGLPPGTYFARTIVSPATPYYTDAAFGNASCAPCDVTTSTAITVTANATATANFALSAGGSIAGAVTDASNGNPLASIDVQLFNATGNLVKTTFSGSVGSFTLDGLPAGTYYARTAVPGGSVYVDKLFDSIQCVSCSVTTGTAIVVTNGATRSGVNFALAPKIAPVPNVITRINTSTVVPITVASAAGAAGVALSASSSNTTLVPNANLVFSGSGTNRTLTITPAANQKGATTITVTASDSTGTTVTSFVLVVYAGGRTGDFDGDRRSDISVFRPSSNTWYVRYSATGAGLSLVWGGAGDVPAPGDYDGDGVTDIAIFRPSTGTWYIRYASTGAGVSFVWGGSGDVPVPGDYDGDGLTDIAVFRPSTGTWYIRYTATGAGIAPVWGGTGDQPVPGDYDGDGKTDIAVFRPSTGIWYIRYTATGTGPALLWGGSGDVAVPGDYDGDGLTDMAIFRPSTGTWYIRYSATGAGTTLVWGGSIDTPVPGDYDGDGLTDIAVFRPSTGTWYVRYSATGAGTTLLWGGVGDIPIP